MKLLVKINVKNLVSLKTDVRRSVHIKQTVLKALDKNIMRYTVTLKHKDTGIISIGYSSKGQKEAEKQAKKELHKKYIEFLKNNPDYYIENLTN